jgi:hypothetical protein
MTKKSRANKSNFADRYTGDLAAPIELPALVGCLNESEAEFERRLVEQLGLKLGKVFDWYKIDPNAHDACLSLALKLAMAHVPGMQIRCERRKPGRKRSWKNGLSIELIRDVAALQKTKKMTYQQAIVELRMNKEKPWGAYTAPNLITRHREARKVEQHYRRLFEQWNGSPLSPLLSAAYGWD